MKLAQLFEPCQIIMEMTAVEHWPAIVELVGHLIESNHLPAAQRAQILDDFRVREELLSTGIGSGIAIPHIFSDHLEKVAAVYGHSKGGVEFRAHDNAPVHFIILFIVPRKDYNLHLRTLAAIAKIFTNCEVLRQLKLAESCDEVLAIFDSKPSRVGA